MDRLPVKTQLSYRSYISRVKSLYSQPAAQTSTALILTLAAAAFFGFAAIKPTLSTVSQLIGELEEKRQLETDIDKKTSTLISLQSQYQTSKDLLTTFDAAMPADINLTQLLRQMEYLLTVNNLKLESMRLNSLVTFDATNKAAASDARSFNVTVTASGKYPEIQQFLDQVTNLDRLIDIKTVFVKKPDADETTDIPPDQLTLTATLVIYWLPK
jgi:Tfp pilus assembly protein PilO